MPNTTPVAILEDDPTQSEWLQQLLSDHGYRSQAFADGGALITALRANQPFQMLLLDWELPGINGMEVLRWARANRDPSLPVMFITHRSQESDLVEGLSAGADDYLSKPIRPAELLARMSALLRRNRAGGPEDSFTLGDFTVDTVNREISLRGGAITLTPKEFDLSALLLRHPWRLFSREDLCALVWNHTVPATSRTLDTHLSNIRRKLQLGPANGVLLSASYALGYRLEPLDRSETNA